MAEQKYCGRCGGLINAQTGTCPACAEAEIRIQQVQQAYPPPRSRTGLKILSLILVCALLACSIIGLLVQFHFLEFTSNKEGREELYDPDRGSGQPAAPTNPEPERDPIAASTEAETEETVPTEATVPLSEVEKHCLGLAEKEDYRGAVEYLLNRMMEDSNDTESAALLPAYQALLKDQVLETAAAYAQQGDHRLAILEVSSAGRLYHCDAFDEAKAEYMTRFAMLTQIAVGREHTVRLYDNGHVSAIGRANEGQLNVSGWSDIVAIVAGDHHTVGLRSDGTVVATGKNNDHQCDVSGWSNIRSIAAGDYHTIGLTEDGRLYATGMDHKNQLDVGQLYRPSPITSVAAGYEHTVALHADGTVSAVGDNTYGQCSVGTWTNVIAVYAGTYHTLGLREDGTVLAAGQTSKGACNVGSWTDIVALSTGDYFSMGLKADGTVVFCGESNDGQNGAAQWTDIVAFGGGKHHAVGLRSDGTIVTAGNGPMGQCETYLLEE